MFSLSSRINTVHINPVNKILGQITKSGTQTLDNLKMALIFVLP